MKHIVIISGGSIDDRFAASYMRQHPYDYLIAADSGLGYVKRAGITPDVILGDFDSAEDNDIGYFREQYPERMRTFPVKKDETDTELALLEAFRAGGDTVTILGGTGTRIDHVLGNIHLLKMALDNGVCAFLTDPHNRIRMIRDVCRIRKGEQFGTYLSVLPFSEMVSGLTMTGVEYPVSGLTLVSGISRGISNRITGEEAVIRIREGLAVIIESRD